MSGTTENDLAKTINDARYQVNLSLAWYKSAPAPVWLTAISLIMRVLELMFARLAKLEDRLLGLAQTIERKATERVNDVTPGQTAYEAWRKLPQTKETYPRPTPWHSLQYGEKKEWESIASAVVDKHGREQAPTNQAVVDEGLVDKLARAYIDYRKQDSRWDKMSEADKSDVRYEMRIILGELLKMPCELPTSEPIVYMLDECDIPERSTNLTKARHLSEWLRERLGPAIAAKDARIAELERMGEHACYERDDALERLAKLEKRHAELLATAQVALEHWGSDDAEHEAAAMTELQRLVDEVA